MTSIPGKGTRAVTGGIFALLLAFNYVAALAQVTVYTDQAAFLTAAQAGGSLAFTDNLNSGSQAGSTVTLSNLTLTGSSLLFPNTNLVNAIDGTGYYRFLLTGGAVTFTFNSPITAFGFETNPRAQGVGQVLGVDVGGTGTSFTMPLTDTTEFRGFVSSNPFTTLTLSNPGGATDFYGVDNLVAYGAAVPEPGTYAAISGAVVFGIALYSRRRG